MRPCIPRWASPTSGRWSFPWRKKPAGNPRDIEASVADIENAFLYNLDDLAKIAESNRAARQAEVDRARVLLAEKVAALWSHVAPQVGQVSELTPHPERSPASG